jgi:peptidoglycan/xylan/chitin deacetylase (PgdA/CDA1 family)
MQAIPVLMYHHVSPNPGLVTVSPNIFEQQMRWLHRRGYHSLTATQFVDFLQGKAFPAKSVLITFDDGYLDNYVHAYPILQHYQMHAVLFIVTSWMGEGPPRFYNTQAKMDLPICPSHHTCMRALKEGRADEVMLRWSEIEIMQRDGTFEFHSHTHTHTRWDKLYVADQSQKCEELRKDLIQAQIILKEKLRQSSAHLCWPQGYYDKEYTKVASALGYHYIYTTEKHINMPITDPSKIGRIVIKDKANPWFASRMWLYRSALFGKAYLALRGKR